MPSPRGRHLLSEPSAATSRYQQPPAGTGTKRTFMTLQDNTVRNPGPAARGSRRRAGDEKKPRSRFRMFLSRVDTKASPYFFVSPFFIVFAIFGAFPLFYTFWLSLNQWPLLGEHKFIGLHNYSKLLHDAQFWHATENTFGIFFVATIPQFILALWLANTLSRR